MNKVGSAAKVKLNSFDDLFGTEQPQAGIEQVPPCLRFSQCPAMGRNRTHTLLSAPLSRF